MSNRSKVANLPDRIDLDRSHGTYFLEGPIWAQANNNVKTPETNYLTLTLKALGFSTFNTNLLVIPSSVLFILQLLFWTWLSEKINQRFLVGLISQIWVIPLLIALEVLPAKFPHSNWVRYAISSLIVGYPYVHAILGKPISYPSLNRSGKILNSVSLVAVTSRNAGTVRTRTVGSSLYNMAVQTSNIISTQVCDPARLHSFRDMGLWLTCLLLIRFTRIKTNHCIGQATRCF